MTIVLPTKSTILDYSVLNLYFCHQILLPLSNCLIRASSRTSNISTAIGCYKDENSTATEVARSISALDAVNFMSAAWNDVSTDTIRNCFFHSLTPAVPDEPFLGFSSDEIPPSFMHEMYTQYVSLDDDLEVTGVQDDADICEEVLQHNQVETDDVNEKCSAGATAVTPPKNKEVLHTLGVIQ